jgi:signal peptidase I
VEAFVIPTGSMAETLYGYKKTITCPECGFVFPVNASDEADPPPGRPKQKVIGYCCPNCRYETPTGGKDVDWGSGDRVLVGKFFGVKRGDVVVFKYPEAPQTNQTAQNYIKRLVGMPGETVAVYRGDLYVTDALTYPPDTDVKAMDLWMKPNTYPGSRRAEEMFVASRADGFTSPSGFRIVRKPDDLVMAMRRIVYDNDHQSAELVKAGHPPRWQAGGGWKADDPAKPKAFTHSGGEFDWVRYQHLMPPHEEMRDPRVSLQNPSYRRPGWTLPATEVTLKPRKITNFLGYNSGFPEFAKAVPQEGQERASAQRESEQIRNGEKPEAARQWNREYQDHLGESDLWVGDLMVECTATVGDGGAVVLQVSKGDHSYRAEFDGGTVRLKMFPNESDDPDGQKRWSGRPRPVAVGDDTFTLAGKPSGVRAGGTHRLRFANVDCRLRVWVDDRPIDFGGANDYSPPKGTDSIAPADGSTAADVEWPAAVGASGTASVSGLKVWRDTYYVNYAGGPLDTYYVQPGHYICMGDNSSQSSDGRMWGLVPERLMLGRAVFTFFPVDRIGFIR